VESRGWKLGTARSVATTHLLDAVARHHGARVHETPVGFKYIGQLILQDAIALGGEESAGLSIRGHVPEKDGIVACLLVAEMIGARQTTLQDQLHQLFRRVGREYWPLRTNLHLPHDVNSKLGPKLKSDYSTFLGRRVTRTDRTDGLTMVFENDDWVLLRMSGTEPLLRIYCEAEDPERAARIAEETKAWVFAAAEGKAS
jgi:phosphoglucomutase